MSKAFPMRKVYSVSFPRSGQNLVLKIYRLYFGDAMVYCDPFALGGEDCACGQIPCVNPANTFSKNHDFQVRHDGGSPVLENARYLVQFRSPVRSITSNFKLHCHNQGITPHRFNLMARRHWYRFSQTQIHFWKALVNKWAIEPLPESVTRVICSYQEFLDDPLQQARKAIELASDQPIDEAQLRHAVDTVNPRPLNSLDAFPYFKEQYFAKLESKVSSEMERLGLASWKDSY